MNEASDDSIGDTQAPNSISEKIEAQNLFFEAINGGTLVFRKSVVLTGRLDLVWTQSELAINKQNISKISIISEQKFRFSVSDELRTAFQ